MNKDINPESYRYAFKHFMCVQFVLIHTPTSLHSEQKRKKERKKI